VGVALKLLQDASIPAVRNKRINVLPKMFIFQFPSMSCQQTLNGSKPCPTRRPKGRQSGEAGL